MRWLSCSTTVLLTLVGACSPVAQHWYVPRGGEPTMALDNLRQAADMALRDHCARLMRGRGSAAGEALLLLEVDRRGEVRRARIKRSTGDRAVDDLFGTLATRMRVERAASSSEDTVEGEVEMGYSCAPNVAIATIRLNP